MTEHITKQDKEEIVAEPATNNSRPAEPTPGVAPQYSTQRSFGSLKSFFTPNSPALAFGMGALALLVLGLFVWLIVRTNRGGTTDPRVVQTTSPSPSPGNGAQVAANPLATPTPTPQILLALKDGENQVGIDDRGNLVGLDNFPHRDMVKAALITEQAANLVAVSGVGSQASVLRSGPDEGPGFALLGPVGKVIFSTKPTLSWSPLEGAGEYRVEIYDSNFSLVASSPPLTANSWTVPNALDRGQIYSWHVTATKDGAQVKTPVPPAPEAKFKTLDPKLAADVTAARKDYRGSHLALGVLYAQSGMLDEAEREFIALVRANPQSETASKLLANVRAAKK